MKKIYIAAVLSVCTAVLFAGCNTDKNNSETTTEENTTVSSVQETLPGNDASFSEETTLLAENMSGTGSENTTTAEASSSGAESTTTASVPTAPQDGNSVVAQSNEYDILRSGTFYIKGSMTDNTGLQSPLEMAVTSDSVYMLSEFAEGVDVGMLVSGEKIYMIYPAQKAYMEMSEAIMSMVGFDINEMMDSESVDFASFGDLSEAYSVLDEVFNGIQCKIYSIKDGEDGEIKVYMSGNKLIRFASYTAEGRFLSSTEIDTISGSVPADKSAPPADYKAYKGITGMFSFMTLFPEEVL